VLKKATSPAWEETVKFKVRRPCNLNVSIHNKNLVLSDDEVARGTVAPNQLVEGAKVGVTIPLEPQGEISLTIGLSVPYLENYKFSLNSDFLSIGNYHIADPSGNNVFRVQGHIGSNFELKDMSDHDLLHIKKRSFFSLQPSFDLFLPNQPQPILTVTKQLDFGISFQISGPRGNFRVAGDPIVWDFKFFDETGRRVAFVSGITGGAFSVEIAPDQDLPLLLACLMIIGNSIKG